MTRREVYTAVVKPLAGVETYPMSQNVKSMYSIEAIAYVRGMKMVWTRDGQQFLIWKAFYV